MPIARIIVTAVSDEGDTVILWGTTEHGDPDDELVGFFVPAKGEHADAGLAEQASRLRCGTRVEVDYVTVSPGWHLTYGLSAPRES